MSPSDNDLIIAFPCQSGRSRWASNVVDMRAGQALATLGLHMLGPTKYRGNALGGLSYFSDTPPAPTHVPIALMSFPQESFEGYDWGWSHVEDEQQFVAGVEDAYLPSFQSNEIILFDAATTEEHQFVAGEGKYPPPAPGNEVIVLNTAAIKPLAELLRELWVVQTRTESSLVRIFGHPAFRQITSFSRAAIPFMLEHLIDEPERWTVGLRIVTGEDPVMPGASQAQAVDAWLAWGKEHGYTV